MDRIQGSLNNPDPGNPDALVVQTFLAQYSPIFPIEIIIIIVVVIIIIIIMYC
jgi:hypothetical protein